MTRHSAGIHPDGPSIPVARPRPVGPFPVSIFDEGVAEGGLCGVATQTGLDLSPALISPLTPYGRFDGLAPSSAEQQKMHTRPENGSPQVSRERTQLLCPLLVGGVSLIAPTGGVHLTR